MTEHSTPEPTAADLSVERSMANEPTTDQSTKTLLDYDVLIKHVHSIAGICGHCGKKKCAGKSSYSTLPASIPTELFLTAIRIAEIKS